MCMYVCIYIYIYIEGERDLSMGATLIDDNVDT